MAAIGATVSALLEIGEKKWNYISKTTFKFYNIKYLMHSDELFAIVLLAWFALGTLAFSTLDCLRSDTLSSTVYLDISKRNQKLYKSGSVE